MISKKMTAAEQLVTELGISWYDVEVLYNAHIALENGPFPVEEIRDVARKFSAILDLAGVPRESQ